MPKTDRELDENSKQLLTDIDDLKSMERAKRRAARSTPEFHALAEEIEDKARHVFARAHVQKEAGREESPIPEEREEQEPGDWTSKGKN